MRTHIEISHQYALVAGGIPNGLEPVQVDQLTTQSAGRDVRVGQIHPQYGIVLLHVRAEEQQWSAVQTELEARQVASVAVIDPLGPPVPGGNITAAIEPGEGMAM